MKLRITIEAEHEESQAQPIVPRRWPSSLARLSAWASSRQLRRSSLDLDYHDEVQEDGTEDGDTPTLRSTRATSR